MIITFRKTHSLSQETFLLLFALKNSFVTIQSCHESQHYILSESDRLKLFAFFIIIHLYMYYVLVLHYYSLCEIE